MAERELKDHFAVLHLRPGASETDIKKSFRRLAKLWHPDRNQSAIAGDKMTQINTAYEYLKSKDRREMLARRLRKKSKGKTRASYTADGHPSKPSSTDSRRKTHAKSTNKPFGTESCNGKGDKYRQRRHRRDREDYDEEIRDGKDRRNDRREEKTGPREKTDNDDRRYEREREKEEKKRDWERKADAERRHREKRRDARDEEEERRHREKRRDERDEEEERRHTEPESPRDGVRERIGIYNLQSGVRGFHVYRDIWNPRIGEILMPVCEKTNAYDKYAVALLDWKERIVGYVPREISELSTQFIEQGGKMECKIVSDRFVPGKGLEIPCCFSFKGPISFVRALVSALKQNLL